MRILTLTWEFPPRITGGLSMACYGIVKALLKKGVEVDLILPVHERVYFPLRKEEDADVLPASPPGSEEFFPHDEKKKILKWIEEIPSAYRARRRISEVEWIERGISPDEMMRFLLDVLHDGNLFDDVREFTLSAVEISKHLRFDLIHAHDWLAYPAGMMIKKLSRKPLVTHIHATEFDRAGGPGDRRIHDIEYIGMNYADRVVAVSHHTAREVVERYRVDPSKIRVVHNAFVISSARRERIFDEVTVVFVGRITLQKGPDYFIEVARRVIEKTKNVRFIIAGRGDMERMVMERASSWGLGTRILFSGFLNREEVARLFSAADIFVMPSVAEPFGIAALEAMSMGAVAIVAKNSGVAEITHTTYKVDFWDVEKMAQIIVDLVNHPETLKEISKKSMEEARRLRWEDQVEKLIGVYSELLSS